MNHRARILLAVSVMSLILLGGCSNDKEPGEKQDSQDPMATRGEHDRDGGEHDHEGGEHGAPGDAHHDEEGEESGTELGLSEAYDNIRNGARLIMTYSAQSNSFTGTVENVTEETLKQVRVEVHLSNGKELGPTTPTDLAPGEKIDVTLAATSNDFDAWNAHPEVGIGEHGGSEGRGEHDGEGRAEHN